MTNLTDSVRQVLLSIDFPFDSLSVAWKDRTPKVVLGLGRLQPTSLLRDAQCWGGVGTTIIGSRRLISFLNENWGESISSGSYDEIRRSCVKYLVEAGIALKDPDDPQRAPNSPVTGYALSQEFGQLLTAFGMNAWERELRSYTELHHSLRERLREERERLAVRVLLPDGSPLTLSPGKHNVLQKAIINDFLPQFVRSPEVVYIADALARQLYKNNELMTELGLFALDHRLLPDVIVLDRERGWLIIIEAVATSGQSPRSESSNCGGYSQIVDFRLYLFRHFPIMQRSIDMRRTSLGRARSGSLITRPT